MSYIKDIIFYNIENVPSLYEWCHLKILDKKIPVIIILAYKYGLTDILKYLKVGYRLVDKGKKVNLQSNELAIKFRNKTLIYNKYPLVKSLILSGFKFYNTLNKYTFEDFDIKDTYFELMQDKNLSINYLKGIDNFFSFFVDPITRNILLEMNEPTNPRDLLIRAVDMLSTEDCKEAASLSNFRVRTLEKFNAILYNEISRQYAQRLGDKTKNKTFSINTEAVFMRIIQDQANILVDEINPIQNLKEKAAVTYVGFSGRDDEAFVERDRKFPIDGLGLLSEAAPDNGKVGINAYLTFNPNMTNLRGFLDTSKSLEEQDSGNLLSVTGALVPFSICDDTKRANFMNVQISHHIGTKTQKPLRVRTGLESVVGDFVSDLYATIAKDNGTIIDVDEKAKIFKIQYKDKTIDAFHYGKRHGEVSGTIIEHNIQLNDIKKGKKIKKGDVLCYNDLFFKLDPIDNKLNWSFGTPAKIGFIDVDITNDDSCAITKEFSQKLSIDIVYPRYIKVGNDMKVNSIVKVGDKVDYLDPLISLEFTDVDMVDFSGMDDEYEESMDLLQDLNRIVTKAKHKGVISNIKIYHTGNITDFDKSIQNIIKNINKHNKYVHNKVKDTVREDEFIEITQIDEGTRIKMMTLNENEILFMFYITETIPCAIGDKLVVGNSQKTVVGDVVDEYITENGQKLDMIFGGDGIFNRMVLGLIKYGLMDMYLQNVEQKAIDMYFK
jgi:hypothetical protein